MSCDRHKPYCVHFEQEQAFNRHWCTPFSFFSPGNHPSHSHTCQLPPLPLPLAQTTSSTPSPPSTRPPVNPYLTTPSLNPHLSTPSLNPHLSTPSLNPHLTTPSLNPHLTNHLSTPSLNPHPSTPPPDPPRPALQSYAGKYVPAIGYRIYIANMDPKTKFKIPLKGIMIGDGFSDPVNVSLPLLDAASPHKCVQKSRNVSFLSLAHVLFIVWLGQRSKWLLITTKLGPCAFVEGATVLQLVVCSIVTMLRFYINCGCEG